MSTPLTDSINALTTYANEVTGASDTTLSDAVHTLANGYGQGGTPKWKDFSGGNIQAIIGDGNAYINTGLLVSHNSIFGIKFKPRDMVNYEYIFGDWCASHSERVAVQRNSNGSTFYAYPVMPAYAEIVTDIAIIESGFINRGGNAVSTSPLLLLKGYYSGREETQVSKAAFYGLNLVDSNFEYLLRLVPWKDENDVICVKNLVTGDIYYNAGTGSFGYIDWDGIEHV